MKVTSKRDPRAGQARGFALSVAVAAGLAVCVAGSAAHASTITTLFSTGVDSSHLALPGGSLDPHYTVVENGNASAVVISPPLPGTYAPNTSTSTWVWQQSNGQPINVTRTFVTTFDLTGLDPTTAIIDGAWGTDNQGLAIKLNGVDTGVAPLLGVVVDNFNHLHDFTISSGFVAGLNTLEFVIEDNGSVGAFRADLTGTADLAAIGAVPLPAALPLFAGGLGVIGLFARGRKRAKRV